MGASDADAGAHLVHADLHYGNVLAGTRQPWLAIDPRAIAGDPELSVPELMWTQLDEAEHASDIRSLLAALIQAAALDPGQGQGMDRRPGRGLLALGVG